MEVIGLAMVGLVGLLIGTQVDKPSIKESDPIIIEKEVYRCGKIDLDKCPLHIKPKSK